METVKLILSYQEYEILRQMIEEAKADVDLLQQENGDCLLVLSNEDAEILAQKIKDKLVLEGFDQYYNITPPGRIYESIVDKFSAIGW